MTATEFRSGSPARCPHLIFDLDGTLTDPREGILRCFQYALTRLGADVPDEAALERHIGPPLRDTLRWLGWLAADVGMRRALANGRGRT